MGILPAASRRIRGRTQTRTLTVLHAALNHAVRSRALRRALIVAGLVVVGWLIGGTGQAAAATAPPVDPTTRAIATVLRGVALNDSATKSVPADLGTAGSAVQATITAVKIVALDLPATAGNLLHRTVVTGGSILPVTGETRSADHVPTEDNARTPRAVHQSAELANARPRQVAVTVAKGPETKTKKTKTKKTRQLGEAADRPEPVVPTRHDAGALPPVVNGGGAVAGGWIAVPHWRHGSATAPRPLLAIAPRLGAGLPLVNAVVDEPSFSPD